MPLCWMHLGPNEILIYDEDGRDPSQVRLYAEPNASRDLVTLQGKIKEP